MKPWLRMLGASAIYGFAVGSAHSFEASRDNLIKFPLLIVITTITCGLGYLITSRFLAPVLPPKQVRSATAALYRDLAILLCSLSPVTYFLGITISRSDDGVMGEYDLFLGLNVAFIAISGSVALVRQWLALCGRGGLLPGRSVAILSAWVALSVVVGGQSAFYLRPFFGMPLSRGVERPFVLGTEPTLRGARNFFEVIWYLAVPPQDDTGRTGRTGRT